jgi:hypothetical protein
MKKRFWLFVSIGAAALIMAMIGCDWDGNTGNNGYDNYYNDDYNNDDSGYDDNYLFD